MRSKTEFYSIFINTFPEGWMMVVDGKIAEETYKMLKEHKEKGHKVEWVLMRDETAAYNAALEARERRKEIPIDEYFKNKNRGKK